MYRNKVVHALLAVDDHENIRICTDVTPAKNYYGTQEMKIRVAIDQV